MVIAIQLMQVLSGEGKGGSVPVVETDARQVSELARLRVAAVAQKECSLEYVGGFEVGHFLYSPPGCPILIFGRRCGRRKKENLPVDLCRGLELISLLPSKVA